MSSKYDAFISYRHSELDKFVATTLHKKLESFKLPKNVKSPTGKKKIERVFRDQDELPLASNLSDPITEALENSDYLLVICTPRLPESEWCKKEIETFIKLHGRDKVLAVLAEGEPEESFPEALTKEAYEVLNPDGTRETKYRIFEPLAADVRGKNNKAIKKAMNDAILRICAAMFGLNYDELKQRHKERAMRRTISIVSAIAAALMLFSAVCMGLMFKIINQSDMILDQNAEIKKQYSEIEAQSKQIQEQKDQIEEQYTEAQINLAEATTINADNLLSMGRNRDSIYALRQVMPKSSDDTSFPYTAKTEYALTRSLELYSSPTRFYADKTFESESIIDVVKVSPNNNILATFDACGDFHIWNSDTGEEIFSKVITGNYSSNENSFDFANDNTIIYSHEKGIYLLNLTDLSEIKLVNPTGYEDFYGNIIRLEETGMFAIFNNSGFGLFNAENGENIIYHDISEYAIEDITAQSLSEVKLSPDKKKIIFSLSNALSKKAYLVLYNLDSNSFLTKDISMDHCSSLTIYDDAIYLAGYTYGEMTMLNFDDILLCLDPETLKLKWKIQPPGTVYDVKPSSEGKYIFGSGYNSLYVFDSENGNLIYNQNASSRICNLYSLGKNNARVLTSDCLSEAFIDGMIDMYTSDIFNTTPNIRAEKFYPGNNKVYIKFENRTYVSMYIYKGYNHEPIFEDAAFSIVMTVDKDGNKIIRQDANDSISLYSLDTKKIMFSVNPSNTNVSFVGDGNEFFAAFSSGLEVFSVTDGALINKVESVNCPGFDEGAITNDRLYLFSQRDPEDHIFLYSLTTGNVEDIFKPNIPSHEFISVYGLDKEHYAVKRASGALEVYKGKSTKPCFTSKRLLSFMDDVKVIKGTNIFAISYYDGSIEFYRFGDSCELIQTYNFSNMISSSMDELIYYPAQKMYVITLGQKTLIFNENLEAVAFMSMRMDYLSSKDCFVYYDESTKSIYSEKHYNYSDLIYESEKILSNYNPSKLIIDKYNLIY